MQCKCGKSMMKGQTCKACGYGMAMKKGEETTSEHGEREVKMSVSQLHGICDMADKLKGAAGKEKMIPAWVQNHLAVAHENLSQVFGYMEPKHHGETKKAMGAAMTPHAPKAPAMPKAKAPRQPKGATMGAMKGVTDVALSEDETSMKKSEAPAIPTFPRISGGSDRILLDHLQPDQGVIQTIADRNTFAPVTVPLKPADPTKL